MLDTPHVECGKSISPRQNKRKFAWHTLRAIFIRDAKCFRFSIEILIFKIYAYGHKGTKMNNKYFLHVTIGEEHWCKGRIEACVEAENAPHGHQTLEKELVVCTSWGEGDEGEGIRFVREENCVVSICDIAQGLLREDLDRLVNQAFQLGVKVGQSFPQNSLQKVEEMECYRKT
ncbi:MAG: hypothetical protein KBC48_02495 [Candidatus Pacebacteria bacterium]|nr:hypothetical protein [Candidatus Paceibacterota bacterium]